MKISIDSRHFDTLKAKAHWDLERFDDQGTHHMGAVFLSSSNMFYAYTPSQWSNQYSWKVMSASAVLSLHGHYLRDNEKQAIAEAGGVIWE